MTVQDSRSLEGLRVLDLTQFLAGPYATQILADMGADVVKVERPKGDLTRHLPPHFVGDDSAYFLSVNRNKRSVVVDLQEAGGADLVRRMTSWADVVVENYRPGVLDHWGISAEDITASRPDLVWCAISGFGTGSPYQDLAAYDMVIQAMSGGMSMTGEEGGSAVRTGIPISDLAAGMYAVIGILGLRNRVLAGGVGGRLDISLLDCQIAMLSYQGSYFLNSGVVPGRQGSGHDSIPTYRGFVCGDERQIVVTANTERMWEALCQALGLTELLSDERFVNNDARYRNREALWQILESRFRQLSASEAEHLLLTYDVPVALVRTVGEALEDQHAKQRGMVLHLRDSERGLDARVPGNPLKEVLLAKAADNDGPGYPPALGRDTRTFLLDDLGVSDGEYEDLLRSRVIRPS